MRARNRLTVKGIAAAAPGKYADGGGLWLVKREDGGAQWVQRITINGKRREMGLGAFPNVGLAEVRKLAEDARSTARNNFDPIKERERQRREQSRNLYLLRDIALDAFESRKADLKGDGKAGRWFSPLELHVLPKLGNMPVGEIDQIDIKTALEPIWHSKAETARKSLNRLHRCLRHAAALGMPIDLQITQKAQDLLGTQRHKTKPIPALDWREVPEFYASLNDGGVTHLALRLLILTGVRSGPLRYMHKSQIKGDVWTIPGETMKGRKDATPDYRVPLSSAAISVIDQVRKFERDGFLFSGVRKGVISDQTMSSLMKRRQMEARPHGFRTSLRVWLAEETEAPHEVAEMMLAHQTGSKVVNAYRRTDFLDKRRELAERWANFVSGSSRRVIPFREIA